MKDHSSPRTLTERLYIFFTGLCMGAADVVPGVSGGTMALIMDVYEDLLKGIKSFDLALVRDLLDRKWSQGVSRVPWQFLFLLIGGIATAILALARVIKHLYEEQQVFLFAFFFGLIVASILVLARSIPWSPARVAALFAGSAFGWFFVVLTPRQMPHDPLTLFLCGGIAIMAMILPGISGSFLLLILGQYAWVLEQVNRLTDGARALDMGEVLGAFLSLLPLGLGAVCGLLLFARVLSWLLNRWHAATLAALVGFMVGSLRKIWPWREVTLTEIIGDKERILADRMVLPEANADLAFALFLLAAGIALILGLEAVQRKRAGSA